MRIGAVTDTEERRLCEKPHTSGPVMKTMLLLVSVGGLVTIAAYCIVWAAIDVVRDWQNREL